MSCPGALYHYMRQVDNAWDRTLIKCIIIKLAPIVVFLVIIYILYISVQLLEKTKQNTPAPEVGE